MKITVLGCGRWGTFLACYHSKRNEVMLWGRKGGKDIEELMEKRENSYLKLPDKLLLSDDIDEALGYADVYIISISAQNLRDLMENLKTKDLSGKLFIFCMKGIEASTGMRLTQVAKDVLGDKCPPIAVWVGPGHVQDFCRGIPNCMVVDSENPNVTNWIVENLNSDLIRLYKGSDIIGTEVGAAAKNVIGIAAGMLDGKNMCSLKGALMARGAREISRLIKAMGGNELSAYGLCHLGDYEATLFSPHSHNRCFGEAFIKGEPYKSLAEGYATDKALVKLGEEYGVDLPICNTLYEIMYNGKDADSEIAKLFSRSVKGEFDK